MQTGIETGARQLSAPFSTRTVLKIAGIHNSTPCYTPQKLVEMCYSLRLPSEEREYVLRTVNDVFGHETDKQKEDLSAFTIAKVDLTRGIKVQPQKIEVVMNTKQEASVPTVKTEQQYNNLDLDRDLAFLNNYKVA